MSHLKDVRRVADVVVPQSGQKYVGEDGSVTKVLDDFVDEDYEPTDEEVREFAEFIGMKLPEDEEFLYIARNALKTPLPKEWKPCEADGDNIFYFNFKTGESTWDHPMDELAQRTFENEKAKKLMREQKAGGHVLSTDPSKNEEAKSNTSPKSVKTTSPLKGAQKNGTPSFQETVGVGEKRNTSNSVRPSALVPKENKTDSTSLCNDSNTNSTNSLSSKHRSPLVERTIFTEDGSILQKEVGRIVPTLVSHPMGNTGKPVNSNSIPSEGSMTNTSLSGRASGRTSPRGEEVVSSSFMPPVGLGLAVPRSSGVPVEARGEGGDGKRTTANPRGVYDGSGSSERNGAGGVGMGTSASFSPSSFSLLPSHDAFGQLGMDSNPTKGGSTMSKPSSSFSPPPASIPLPSNPNLSSDAPLRSEAEEKLMENVRLEIVQELKTKKEAQEKELNEKTRALREEHNKKMTALRDENTKQRRAWQEEQKEKWSRDVEDARLAASSQYSGEYHQLERRAEDLQEEVQRLKKNTEGENTTYHAQKDTIEREAAAELKDALQQVVTEVEQTKRKREEELEMEYLRRKTEMEKSAAGRLREEQEKLDALYTEKIEKAIRDFEKKKEQLEMEKTRISREIEILKERKQQRELEVASGGSGSTVIAASPQKDDDDEAKEKEEVHQRVEAIEKAKAEKLEKMRIESEKERRIRRESQQIELEKMHYFIDVAKKAKENAEKTLQEMETEAATRLQEATPPPSSSLTSTENLAPDTEQQIKALEAEKANLGRKWEEEEKVQLSALQKEREERLEALHKGEPHQVGGPDCTNGGEEAPSLNGQHGKKKEIREKDEMEKIRKHMKEVYEKELAQQKERYKRMEDDLSQQLANEREEHRDDATVLQDAVEQDIHRYVMEIHSRRELLEKEYRIRLEQYQKDLANRKAEAKAVAVRRWNATFQSRVEEALKVYRHPPEHAPHTSAQPVPIRESSLLHTLEESKKTREGGDRAEKEGVLTSHLDHPHPFSSSKAQPKDGAGRNPPLDVVEEEMKAYEKRTLWPILEKVAYLRQQRENVASWGNNAPFSSILFLLDSTRLQEAIQLEHEVRRLESAYQNVLVHQGGGTRETDVTDGDGASGGGNSEEESFQWVRRADQEAHLRDLAKVYQEQEQYLTYEMNTLREFIQMAESNSKKSSLYERNGMTTITRSTGNSSTSFPLPLASDRKGAIGDPLTTISCFGGCRTSSAAPDSEPASLSMHTPLGVVPGYSVTGTGHPRVSLTERSTPTAATAVYGSLSLATMDNLGTDEAVRLLQIQQMDHARRCGVLQAAKTVWEQEVREVSLAPAGSGVAACSEMETRDEEVDEPQGGRPPSLLSRGVDHSCRTGGTARMSRPSSSTEIGSIRGEGSGDIGGRGSPGLAPVEHSGKPPLTPTSLLSPQQTSLHASERSGENSSTVSVTEARQLQEKLDCLAQHVQFLTQETARYRSFYLPFYYSSYYPPPYSDTPKKGRRERETSSTSTSTDTHPHWRSGERGHIQLISRSMPVTPLLGEHAKERKSMGRAIRKEEEHSKEKKRSGRNDPKNKRGREQVSASWDDGRKRYGIPSPMMQGRGEDDSTPYWSYPTPFHQGRERYRDVHTITEMPSSCSPLRSAPSTSFSRTSSVLYRFLNSPSVHTSRIYQPDEARGYISNPRREESQEKRMKERRKGRNGSHRWQEELDPRKSRQKRSSHHSMLHDDMCASNDCVSSSFPLTVLCH